MWLRASCEWPTHSGWDNLGPELGDVWGRGVPTVGVESRIMRGHCNLDPIVFVTILLTQLYCCISAAYSQATA